MKLIIILKIIIILKKITMQIVKTSKILKAKATYDSLLDEMSELLDQRYPERREEAIKERLYDAYRRSGKSIDFIIDFIENADDDGYVIRNGILFDYRTIAWHRVTSFRINTLIHCRFYHNAGRL